MMKKKCLFWILLSGYWRGGIGVESFRLLLHHIYLQKMWIMNLKSRDITTKYTLTRKTFDITLLLAAQGRFGRKPKGAGNGQHEAPGTRIFQKVRTSILFSPLSTVAT